MRWVRTWLPLAIIVAGVASIVATGGAQWGFEGGMLIISAGLSVWLLNVLHRVGVRGDRERDREAEARAYFDRHGRWPDDRRSDRDDG
jgi:membrane protein implicated in regulation of membrane protease activity